MNNENKVQVKAIRTFEGEEGFKSPGDKFEVTRQRAADLKANGLIKEIASADPAEEKAAPAADTKQAPEPSNKAAAKPANK
jgi:hypothetical protein